MPLSIQQDSPDPKVQAASGGNNIHSLQSRQQMDEHVQTKSALICVINLDHNIDQHKHLPHDNLASLKIEAE
eukprot:6088969-Ditylum_brightwellii.AAC.1